MKRHAPGLKLLLFLVAGAITNASVAWGCAAMWNGDKSQIGVSAFRLVGSEGGFLHIATGLPMRACYGVRVGSRWWDADQQTMVFEMKTNTFWTINVNTRQMLLPLRLIWRGFAINTIFYAAVLWVLFAVPMKVRRWRRIKRGQCASCGYSLRGRGSAGDACPECGAATSLTRD